MDTFIKVNAIITNKVNFVKDTIRVDIAKMIISLLANLFIFKINIKIKFRTMMKLLRYLNNLF